MSNTYDDPAHPLHGVPKEILAAAREEMQGAAVWKDVAEDMVEPLADAIVMSLLPWLRWDRPRVDFPT